MVTASSLRALGPQALADALRRRPEVLRLGPPRSLGELAARLVHPYALSAVLRRLNRPTLQVAEALAALGAGADRARLERLLGIGADAERKAALDDAVITLRDHFLLEPGERLIPQLREGWPSPLRLGPSLAAVLPAATADDLRAVLRTLRGSTASRKAELITAISAIFDDPDQVRAIAADAPPELTDVLPQLAFGEVRLPYYGYYAPRHTPAAGQRRDPVEWAMARMLLLRVEWGGELLMPAEVALALRGPNWCAPFEPAPPAVAWTQLAPEQIAGSAAAAAAHAVRVVALVLELAGAQPIPLLKSGAVGVRELRRVAKAVGCTPGEVRLTLALAHRAGMLGLGADGVAPTPKYDAWLSRTPAKRLATLLTAWAALVEIPLGDAESAWQPGGFSAVGTLRGALLSLLQTQPDAAPAAVESLAARIAWQVPWAIGLTEEASGRPDKPITGLLEEADWLGVTGAGALAPAGRAMLAGGDVAATLGEAMGTVQSRARLQADLTAVVLGHPSAELAAALDRMADREGQSAAITWRFSAASIRAALDAGAAAPDLLAALAELAEGAVPQPLAYLIGDVARRHGVLRGADVACYLRSEDEALLAEVIVDRRLSKLGLRRIAPTVVVGSRPLAETLAALRGAGLAPVQEAADGTAVLTRAIQYRASATDEHFDTLAGELAATPREEGAFVEDDPERLDQLVSALLAAPDRPRGRLLELPDGVIDATSYDEAIFEDAALFDDGFGLDGDDLDDLGGL